MSDASALEVHQRAHSIDYVYIAFLAKSDSAFRSGALAGTTMHPYTLDAEIGNLARDLVGYLRRDGQQDPIYFHRQVTKATVALNATKGTRGVDGECIVTALFECLVQRATPALFVTSHPDYCNALL